MPKHADTDLETRIVEAERAVVELDTHFLRSTGELASAMRGRAGKAAATSAITGAALLAVVAAVMTYRAVAARSEREQRKRMARGAPAVPVPLRRSGAAGFIGETIGSAMRAAAAPRTGRLLSLLSATLLPMAFRLRRARPR